MGYFYLRYSWCGDCNLSVTVNVDLVNALHSSFADQ
jgi:hypothetical protein